MKRSSRLLVTLITLLFLLSMSSGTVFASALPFNTFSALAGQSGFGEAPPMYEPDFLFAQEVVTPEDLFYANGKLYLADSGAGRILVYDLEGNFIQSVGEGLLSEPSGVFVTATNLYVADRGNQVCYKMDLAGEVLHTYERPDTPLFGKNEAYVPSKLVVNRMGDLYIISEGSQNGIIQMSDTGEFIGYFGVNDIALSPAAILQRLLLLGDRSGAFFAEKPPSPENIAIDDQGMIYTITNSAGENQRVKKLNIAGKNIIDIQMASEMISDVAVDADGNVFTLSENGELVVYDSFGGVLSALVVNDTAERRGVFVQGATLCVDETGSVYVADKVNATITKFVPTEIAKLIFSGVALYRDGKYLESQELFEQVLARNEGFAIAHQAMGKAYFKQGKYQESLQAYRLSGDLRGYAESFWQLRNDWLIESLKWIFLVLLLLVVVKSILRQLDRKKQIYDPIRRQWSSLQTTHFYAEMRTPFYMLRHPIDAIDYIKNTKSVTYVGFTALFVWFLVSQMLSHSTTGFLFESNLGQTNLLLVLVVNVIVFVSFVLSNYLVSTITDGEGSFQKITIGAIAALSPLYLLGLPVHLMTNILTLNEAFLYSFGMFFLFGWVFVLLFFVVKDIHNYAVGETIRNLVLTFIGMVILLLVVFIFYVLMDQVVKFVIHFM